MKSRCTLILRDVVSTGGGSYNSGGGGAASNAVNTVTSLTGAGPTGSNSAGIAGAGAGLKRTLNGEQRRKLWEDHRIMVVNTAVDAALHLFKQGMLASYAGQTQSNSVGGVGEVVGGWI